MVPRWIRRQFTADASFCSTESAVSGMSAGMPLARYDPRFASLHAYDGCQIDVPIFDSRVVSL